MKKLIGATAALAMALAAAPAWAHDQIAQSRGVVVLNPGASTGWVMQQPTSFLNTEMAQVLPDGLAYVTGGGGLSMAGMPASVLNYRRGMGGGSELGFGLGLNLNAGAAQAFGAGVNGGFKWQLSRSGSMAVALDLGLGVAGIGGATTVGGTVGLPLTFDVGLGHLTAQPKLMTANFGTGTAGLAGALGIGLMTPLASNWQLLADVTPTFSFGGAGTAFPIGIGTRFSPTATSHVDFTIGQVNTFSPFTAGFGLVGATAYVGF
jgi:hypothetical protein